jgi:hypothetical protein
LDAPINLYFDVTPVGRVLNRLSQDFSVVESEWAWVIQSFQTLFYSVV